MRSSLTAIQEDAPVEKKAVQHFAPMAPKGAFCYPHRCLTQAANWRAAIRKLCAQHFLVCE
jgi:hypothetical protein